MSAAATALHWHGGQANTYERRAATREAPWVKGLILAVALSFFAIFLFLPLVAVFVEALRKGLDTYWTALVEPDALSVV